MRYRLADDAKPQITLLLLATALTFVLWFIPFADYLVYPIRLFVTFVHEGGHALAAILTGGSVQSLTVAPDSSGLVKAYSGSQLATLIFSRDMENMELALLNVIIEFMCPRVNV